MTHYYQMSGVLPLHASKHYQIHQMMEVIASQAGGEQVKGKYRYIIIPKGPGSCHYLLRSGVELAGASVSETSLALTKGELLSLQCSISLLQSFYPDPDSKKRRFFFHNEPDKIRERVAAQLARAGLRDMALEVSSPQVMKISKPRHRFTLPYTVAAGTVMVVDPQLAESALVNGIGEKRAFGLGLPLFQLGAQS